jgi:nitrate reductase NapE component
MKKRARLLIITFLVLVANLIPVVTVLAEGARGGG